MLLSNREWTQDLILCVVFADGNSSGAMGDLMSARCLSTLPTRATSSDVISLSWSLVSARLSGLRRSMYNSDATDRPWPWGQKVRCARGACSEVWSLVECGARLAAGGAIDRSALRSQQAARSALISIKETSRFAG